MPRAVVSGTLIGLVVPAACGPGKHSAGTPSPRRYFTISRRKPAWQGTGKPLPSPAFDRTCNKSNPRRCAMQTADVREKMTRSEEHTSELQSPYDLVCRLLLEKKKKKRRRTTHT